MIREAPHYRRDVFVAGLTASGYELVERIEKPQRGDILVIWNRYGHWHKEARRFEAAGAAVLVCENGYCGKDENGRQLFAIGLGGHAGAGALPYADDGGARWRKLGIELGEWRSAPDGHILICAQRGFTEPVGTVGQPPMWVEKLAARLQGMSAFGAVKIRQHPGNTEDALRRAKPLARDLAGAYCVVTWASRCGIDALIAGVPVVYGAPWWVGRGACLPIDALIAGDEPEMRDDTRLEMFHRLAWAQWSGSEIAAGTPFMLMRELAAA